MLDNIRQFARNQSLKTSRCSFFKAERVVFPVFDSFIVASVMHDGAKGEIALWNNDYFPGWLHRAELMYAEELKAKKDIYFIRKYKANKILKFNTFEEAKERLEWILEVSKNVEEKDTFITGKKRKRVVKEKPNKHQKISQSIEKFTKPKFTKPKKPAKKKSKFQN